jgi:hypothetical protein
MPGNGNRQVLHGAVIAAVAVTAMVPAYRRGFDQLPSSPCWGPACSPRTRRVRG